MIATRKTSTPTASAPRCRQCGGPFMVAHGIDGTSPLKPRIYEYHCSCCGGVMPV